MAVLHVSLAIGLFTIYLHISYPCFVPDLSLGSQLARHKLCAYNVDMKTLQKHEAGTEVVEPWEYGAFGNEISSHDIQ